MRVLLLGESAIEPGFVAWQRFLARAGTPFDAIALDRQRRPPVIEGPSGELRYQALILSRAGLIEAVLDAGQRMVLDRAARDLGLRRLTAYAYPGPGYGLDRPAWAGELGNTTATLTDAGRELFPYLVGRVPIDEGTWGYLSKPTTVKRFQTLLTGPAGSSLLGIHRDDQQREQMVQTFDTNWSQLHGHLLRQGQLSWLARGVHFGMHRNYLAAHVDDVLMANHAWSVTRHVTNLGSAGLLRMTSDDAIRTARWSRRRKVRLDLACNGAGSLRFADGATGRDPLLHALLSHRNAFGWINHTFEHRNLDRAAQQTIEDEIDGNLAWAAEHGIELEPQALVTGEHSGLANRLATPPRSENPDLAAALSASGIRVLGCDASTSYPSCGTNAGSRPLSPGTPFFVGDAFVVPRFPTVLAHDVATERQLLDRLRASGGAGGSWRDVAAAEARTILVRIVGNDPRPHYFHQCNLIADRSGRGRGRRSLLCVLLDATLSLYRSLISTSTPIVQPTMTEIGGYLVLMRTWRGAVSSGSVRGYVEAAGVVVVNLTDSPLEIPLTGTSAGDDYGGVRSGWVSVPPGRTVFEVHQPAGSAGPEPLAAGR